jgi:hypothetical protein
MNINERTAPLKLVGTAPSSNEGGEIIISLKRILKKYVDTKIDVLN